MSYILDALRKSETERQQGRVPDLAQSVQMVHKPRRKPIPLAIWVALGFFVNALVLAVIFWPGTGFLASAVDAKTDSASTVSENKETSKTADSAEPPQTEIGVTSPVTRSQADNAKIQTIPDFPTGSDPAKQAPPPDTTARNNAGEAIVPMTDQSTVASQSAQPSQGPPNTGQQSDEIGVDYVAGANQQEQQATLIVPDRSQNRMPTFQGSSQNAGQTAQPLTAEHLVEKQLAYQRRIPTLRFSSHIYASDPASRRVTINGHYLRAGDSFDGIRVEAINSNGVILSAYGESFRVGVVSDWVSPR